MEKLSVVTGSDLVDWRGVQIDEDGSWDIFSATALGKEGFQSTNILALLLLVWLSVGLKTVLQKVTSFES